MPAWPTGATSDAELLLASAPLSRAQALPLAFQHRLVLRCADALQCKPAAVDTGTHDESRPEFQLLQLLAAATDEHHAAAWCWSTQQLASLALRAVEQHEHHPLHAPACATAVQQLISAAHAAPPPPSWLTPCQAHCFGWLEQRKSGRETEGSVEEDAAATATGTKQQQQPQHQFHAVPGCSSPERATKRARVAQQPTGGWQSAAIDAEAAAPVLLDQLRVLADTCDAAGVDCHQLLRVLGNHQDGGRQAGGGSAGGLRQQHTEQLGSCWAADEEDAERQRVPPAQQQQQKLTAALAALSADALRALLDSAFLIATGGAGGAGGSDDASAPELHGIAQLLRTTLLPQLRGLQLAAPRALTLCVEAAWRAAPALLLRAVLAPLLSGPPALSAVQTQLLARLAKDSPAMQQRLLQLLLSGSGASAGVQGVCCWGDAHATLARALLDASPGETSKHLGDVVAAVCAAAAAPQLHGSRAIGQLLLSLTRGFGPLLGAPQVAALRAAAVTNASFLAASVARQLDALESHG